MGIIDARDLQRTQYMHSKGLLVGKINQLLLEKMECISGKSVFVNIDNISEEIVEEVVHELSATYDVQNRSVKKSENLSPFAPLFPQLVITYR